MQVLRFFCLSMYFDNFLENGYHFKTYVWFVSKMVALSIYTYERKYTDQQ